LSSLQVSGDIVAGQGRWRRENVGTAWRVPGTGNGGLRLLPLRQE